MTDPTPLLIHGRYTVLASHLIVELRDGTRLALHQVREHAHPEPSRFLRAVLNHPLVRSHIFDVRDLRSQLDADIRGLPTRYEQGVIALTLRQFYPDGAALLSRIVEESLCKLATPEEAAHAPA